MQPTHPSIAVDTVNFAGEIVAVVVARSAAEANDAAELVDVDYEELPAGARPEGGRRPTRSLAHPDLGTNVSAVLVYDSAEAGTGGDVEAAIAAARDGGIVIESEFRQQRLIPAFMEPRSIVADPTAEQLTVWSSTQVPHFVKIFISLVARHPGAQDPGDRARCRRRVRRQAAVHAGGSAHGDRGPSDRKAL